MSTSIITNNSAILAVEILNSTASDLQTTQKQISTGYRVSDAVDDGAAFAVAQRVRSDIGALTTANQQLGNTTGLLKTTLSAVTSISNLLNSAKDVLVELANGQNSTGTTYSQYKQQLSSFIANIQGDYRDAIYNGKSLIGSVSGAAPARVTVVRNEVGQTYGLSATNFSTTLQSLSNLTSGGGATAAANITSTGLLTNLITYVGNALNTYGSENNYVSNQVSYNNNKIDSLNTGLGALVDANLTNESAQLQALQVRQQLATQSLSIANAAPQSLLKLFQ